jgi:acyl-CoA synthetase (AMP-forming)/AMP-acid ligase II
MKAASWSSLRRVPRVLGGLYETGLLRPLSPGAAMRFLRDLRRTGATAAALCHRAAAAAPDRTAVIDDAGALSWARLNQDVLSLRAGLAGHYGLDHDATLAVLCRNHRGFVTTIWAGASLGANVLLLNTDFPAPQLKQVLERHRVDALVCDHDFLPVVREAGFAGTPVVADVASSAGLATLAWLRDAGCAEPGRARGRPRFTLLTSGTTGPPKGAPRSTPNPLAVLGPLESLLERLPLATGSRVLILPPLFHGFGLAFLVLGAALAGTVILRRDFTAEQAHRDLVATDADMAVGVPVMWQRILDHAGEDGVRHHPRALVSAAAPLPPALAERLLGGFGPVVFNIYGASETGLVALATPHDLQQAPGCVGRPVAGVRIALLDEDGTPVPAGQPGRLYIGSGMLFAGYTDGRARAMRDGLMRSGDLARLDEHGRLWIEGRDDDMIVSGGENVYPQEVEDCLTRHRAVRDAAVLGVPDDTFGQRLKAWVAADGADADELRDWIRARLARHKMPREFVFVNELPRNPAGKVDKKRLPG